MTTWWSDSALNLIMESTISRPNLQNIHLIVRFNREKQEEWLSHPAGSLNLGSEFQHEGDEFLNLKQKKIPMIQF